MHADDFADRPEPGAAPGMPTGGIRLSSAQQQAWFLGQLVPNNVAYNFQARIAIRGRLDIPALEHALGDLIARHESLRTTFAEQADTPYQIVHPAWPVALPLVDLAGLPPAMRESYGELLIATEVRKQIDVERLPLVRWLLIRQTDTRHLLLHVEHHLIHDGWSFRLFMRELSVCYSNRVRPGSAEPLPDATQFADYCRWEGRWLETPEGALQRAFWRDRLTGWPVYDNSLFPGVAERRKTLSFAGTSLSILLDEPVLAALLDLAASTRTTLFETMITIFAALVRERRGVDRVVIGTAIANRDQPETQRIIGMLVNMLPLRFAGTGSLAELLAAARDEVREACNNGRIPVSTTVAALQPARMANALPFVQTAFSFHNSMSRNLTFDGLDVEITEGISNGSAKFDVNVIVVFDDETDPRRGGRMLVEYAEDVASETEVAAFFDAYIATIRAWAAAPALSLAALRQGGGQAGGREDDLAYWRRQLAAPSEARLPGPAYRTAVATGSRHRLRHALPTGLPAADLLAAFLLLLSRHTACDDILVGYRPSGETQPLPLRVRLDQTANFGALRTQVAETAQAALAHGGLPLDEILQAQGDERAASGRPPFQIAFALEGAAAAAGDLQATVVRGADGDAIEIDYDDGLFDGSAIRRMADRLERLLAAAARSPSAPVGTLEMIDLDERAKILVWSRGAATDYPERTVHGQFQHWARRQPDAPALRCAGVSWTYAEVDQAADRIAAALRASGVATGSVVGIVACRSAALIAGLLGILKAGAAYLPIEPDLPADRQRFMLSEGGATAVLTDDPTAVATDGTLEVLEIDRLLARTPPDASDSLPSVGPDAPCYIMFTSGSTGTPKGCHSTHRAVVSLLCGSDYLDATPVDRFMAFAPLSFDASTFEIWGALLNGATLVIQSGRAGLDELAETIVSEHVSIVWLTTSLFHTMVESHGAVLAGARRVLSGGDVLSAQAVRSLLDHGTGCRFTAAYGPTECTTFSTCHDVPDAAALGDRLSIGRPIAHSNVYILDRTGQPTPIGVPGEIFIGGAGVAGRYVNRPDLTAERFLSNPFLAGDTLFRSGDLGAWVEDGSIEFLGRADDQVKIRGFRVEPGEVEAAVRRVEGVGHCAVIVHRAKGDKRLAAFVVAAPGGDLVEAGLRDALRAILPDYMVPTQILMLDQLPVQLNGKLDKKRLAWLADAATPVTVPTPSPTAGIERMVATVWAEILGIDRLAPEDDFFALGGHSLAAMRIMSRLSREFGLRLPLSLLFDGPSVRALAAGIGRRIAEDRTPLARQA